MKPAWKAAWFDEGVGPRKARLWRGVEAQHVVSTMRLVDSLEEQLLLEQLLETSKPPLPVAAAGSHYLLFTPFRYRSPFASRFRKPADPGLWYGAETIETACREVEHGKWRFLMDSAGLRDGELVTEHTLFAADVRGDCTDLTVAPWSASAARWTHKTDYADCQALALEARSRGVAWIRYASARDAAGHCGAVISLAALKMSALPSQSWVCKVTRAGAFMRKVP